jgi:hypothetical protein
VFARFGKACVILALVISTGAHWAALQTVAWTAMLAEHLRTSSLTEAVTHTFDGRHPCVLCKAIAVGKKSEHKSEFTWPVPKFEFTPSPNDADLVAPSRFDLLPAAGDFFAEALVFQPPTPPPRAFPA